MENVDIVQNKIFEGERAEFFAKGKHYRGCTFCNGESPLKESQNIRLDHCTFGWKYPLWYAHHIEVEDCALEEMARSGIWYTKGITIRNSVIQAPKTFRRAEDVTLRNVEMPNAKETFWHCKKVRLDNVKAAGDYFGMDCEDVEVRNLKLDGNYCFDGAKTVRVYDSYLNSKDSFWNCEDVEVYDTVIIGEYLGWNTRNLTLVNCTIESLQGLCYIDHLKLVNCQLRGTSLSFEYCTDIDAQVDLVDSVFNPTSGVIRARHIGELTQDPERVDPKGTKIIIKE